MAATTSLSNSMPGRVCGGVFASVVLLASVASAQAAASAKTPPPPKSFNTAPTVGRFQWQY
jgi:hypothetical protein